mmetsp:Transcript_22088/g.57652  ORF Transcript_22088/g.57652 Transcript_22088/m.57652 type:complete len:389 (-) Transcript_22088:517-1683(-)
MGPYRAFLLATAAASATLGSPEDHAPYGTLVWTKLIPNGFAAVFKGPPAIHPDGTTVVAAAFLPSLYGGDKLYGIDAATGEIQWTVDAVAAYDLVTWRVKGEACVCHRQSDVAVTAFVCRRYSDGAEVWRPDGVGEITGAFPAGRHSETLFLLARDGGLWEATSREGKVRRLNSGLAGSGPFVGSDGNLTVITPDARVTRVTADGAVAWVSDPLEWPRRDSNQTGCTPAGVPFVHPATGRTYVSATCGSKSPLFAIDGTGAIVQKNLNALQPQPTAWAVRGERGLWAAASGLYTVDPDSLDINPQPHTSGPSIFPDGGGGVLTAYAGETTVGPMGATARAVDGAQLWHVPVETVKTSDFCKGCDFHTQTSTLICGTYAGYLFAVLVSA